ncbi:hypothetical protein GIB67_031671 [Kingdonia uniflora]|uniref:alpha-1,2-Mannosidase n=1 Tax=Kingdonia uniflora TaxID=39325 RepID=A0A7J7NKD9_9MAGN|nr:hypothetical protein GIB67_031671 [Kingdonia uniflora]
MSKAALPYSMKDVDYDNAKFRHRSFIKVTTQGLLNSTIKRDCLRCSTGKFLVLLMIGGLAYLTLMHTSSVKSASGEIMIDIGRKEKNTSLLDDAKRFPKPWRRQPRLPPQLSLDEKNSNGSSPLDLEDVKWIPRQQKVKEAFSHAWFGYKNYAMGFDELMPLSQRGVDGLGGLGATVVDALDTAMIMGADEVVLEAGTWVEKHLSQRISEKGQVNLFETTIRVLGGLLSAFHLSGGEQGKFDISKFKGPKPIVYLEIARNLADRLLVAFTSSPTPIPFSDVVLRERSAHPAPDGLSSVSEVSTLQLEFNYLSTVLDDPKYGMEAMKVLEHLRTLPKVEGLVPIYIRLEFHKPEFSLKEEKLIVRCSKGILNEGIEMWKDTITGFFIGAKIPFYVVRDRVRALWGIKGTLSMSMQNSIYSFTFEDLKERDAVLRKWTLSHCWEVFHSNKWDPSMSIDINKIQTVPIWVKFIDLPKPYWTARALGYVASAFDNPLC